MLPQKLCILLSSYSQLDQQLTLQTLQSIKLPTPISTSTSSQISNFNHQLQQLLKLSFTTITTQNNITDLCSLLQVLLKAKQNNVKIENKIILTLFDWGLECLREGHVCRLIGVLVDRYTSLGKLGSQDVHLMHKIVNRSLKIISKTSDKQKTVLRAKLHILLTKILQFAHPSGLNLHKPLSHSHSHSFIPKCITHQQFSLLYKTPNIQYNYYHKYWQLYKKIKFHPEEDQVFVNKLNYFYQKLRQYRNINSNGNGNKKFGEEILRLEMFLLNWVQDVQKIVRQVLGYFRIYALEGLQRQVNTIFLLSQNKPQFRISITTLIQAYCYQLRQALTNKNLAIKNNNKFYYNPKITSLDSSIQILTNQQKIQQFSQLIENSIRNIEVMSFQYICDVLGEDECRDLLDCLKMIFGNQRVWEQIKNGDKDKDRDRQKNKKNSKKSVVKILPAQGLASLEMQNHFNSVSSDSINISQNNSTKNQCNSDISEINLSLLAQKTLQIRQQAANKLCISTTKTQNFLLSNPQTQTKTQTQTQTLTPKIKIKKSPISPSFSYYYKNAAACLEKFNWKQNTQEYFQTQQDYNVFQWKAMRSLARESVKSINIFDDKDEYEDDDKYFYDEADGKVSADVGHNSKASSNSNSKKMQIRSTNKNKDKGRFKLMQFIQQNQLQLAQPKKKVKLNIETDTQ